MASADRSPLSVRPAHRIVPARRLPRGLDHMGSGSSRERSRMKAHGITTSKADFWIHLHPLDAGGTAYWYRVPAMRAHIEQTNPPIQPGRSKDPWKTVTGAGYLIAKNTYFIQKAILDPKFCRDFDWLSSTDRERGQRGEQIVAALIDQGIIQLMRQVSTSARNQDDQFGGVDGFVTWQKKTRFEAKTETVVSINLFVQTQEAGHRPNYTADGLKRITTLPLFNKDREP